MNTTRRSPFPTWRVVLGAGLLGAIPFELAYIHGPGLYVVLAALGFAVLLARSAVAWRDQNSPDRPWLTPRQHVVTYVAGMVAVLAAIVWAGATR